MGGNTGPHSSHLCIISCFLLPTYLIQSTLIKNPQTLMVLITSAAGAFGAGQLSRETSALLLLRSRSPESVRFL